MTSLLFANAGVPISSSIATYTGSLTTDSTYPASNLFGGNRTDVHKLETAASGDYRIAIDLGSGNTAFANFLYIGRANLLQYGTVGTITLKAHSANNYGAATTVHTASSFTSTTLYGPDSEDYVTTFSVSSSFRYWWINYNASSSTKFPHAHVFFGPRTDVGINPNGPMNITRQRPTGGRRKALYTFELQYNALPYAVMWGLYSTYYLKRRYNPMILFTTSDHDILLGHRVIFCRLIDMTMPPRATDYFDCTLTFEECL